MELPIPDPEDVLEYWIGGSVDDPVEADRLHKVWFSKSEKVDAILKKKFTPAIVALASGMDEVWAAQGARARLAAIVVFDQFSRNAFRDTPAAYLYDDRALYLCKDGLIQGVDKTLSEIERMFFYLPLEHSERINDQLLSVNLFKRLRYEARPGFLNMMERALDYAQSHHAVIKQFGRFPHRNKILQRENTPAEEDYLADGGGF